MVRQRTHLSLGLAIFAGALALPASAQQSVAAPPVAPQPTQPAAPQMLRLSRDVKGDSKPIIVAADDVVTWVEGTQRLIVVRGRVLAQQNVVQARFQQGVIWIDLQRWKSGILHADLYAEGKVQIDSGTRSDDGDQALLDLNTRGELKLNAYRSKVRLESLANDPLVQRARAARGLAPAAPTAVPSAPPKVAAPAPVIQRTSYQEPAPIPAPTPRPPAAATPAELVAPPSTELVPPPMPKPITSTPSTGPPGPPPAVAPPVRPPVTPPAPQAAAPPASPKGPPLAAPALPLPPPGPGGGDLELVADHTSQQPLQAPGSTALPPPSRVGQPPRGPTVLEGPSRQYSIAPRTAGSFNVKIEPMGDNQQAVIVTGGVILTLRDVKGIGLLDMEADRVVVWTRNVNPSEVVDGAQRSENRSSRDLEFYLSGNVEIRQQSAKDSRLIRADEVYYDANRNTAICVHAELEIKDPKVPQEVIVRATELQQLAPNQFKFSQADIFSSKLPSDPGLKVYVREGTIEEKKVPRLSIFDTPIIDRRTGQPIEMRDTRVDARDVIFKLEDVPFFYLPHVNTNATDPFGPLEDVNVGFSRVFGAQFGVKLDVYELLGIQRYEGTRWRLQADYLSYRGPALGSTFDYSGKDFFGLIGSRYQGNVNLYGIYDRNFDILGGPEFRSQGFDPPGFRGRALLRQDVRDLPYGFTVQGQVSALSDRNFLEQYFKLEFDRDINQSTFLYVKQQEGQFAWTGLVEPRIRNWVNETESLPRVDGWIVGQSFFDLFTYNAHASAGYFQFRPTSDQYPPNSSLPAPRPIYPNPFDVRNFFPRVSSTDVGNSTGRFDIIQDVSLPFTLGAFRLVPYATLDLADYTNDLTNNEIGRIWGGGGLRASVPFSRLYGDAQSELFNVNGIFHKITLSSNYFIAESNESFKRFAQLDRFNDDATDQAVRDVRLYDPSLYGTPKGTNLAVNPLYDPQTYAIRRLIQNRIDTLDDIQVLQFDALQRWQTKRGYPGAQHVIDWMVLDLSGSYFPADNRDNFGKPFAFLEYDYLWNLGDRTALTSSAWVDPFENGTRFYSLGMYFNRPDRTNYFIGYRQIDPLESKAVTASVTYIFSPKYSTSLAATYDFGTKVQSDSLTFTRAGSDLLVSLGLSYNSLQNSFGFVFEIVPVLLPTNQRGGLGQLGQGGLMGRR